MKEKFNTEEQTGKQMTTAVEPKEKISLVQRCIRRAKTVEAKANAMYLSLVAGIGGGVSPFVGMMSGKLFGAVKTETPITAILIRVALSVIESFIVGYIAGRLIPLKPIFSKILGRKYTPKKFALYLVCTIAFIVVPIGAVTGILSNPLIPDVVRVRTAIIHMILDSAISFILLIFTYKHFRKFICTRLKADDVI